MKLFFLSLLNIFLFTSCSNSTSSIKNNFLFFKTQFLQFESLNSFGDYEPRGVGGGGAMSGISLSPYSSLWMVGTDMGTLFRSTNQGENWNPINHLQTKFSPDLNHSVGIGFSANPNILFHAPGGKNPVMSLDAGETWKNITIDLNTDEYIKYWRGHSLDEKIMLAGTNQALWISHDTGSTWTKINGTEGEAIGTYIDYRPSAFTVYHATTKEILKSSDNAHTFEIYFSPAPRSIRAFSAGRDRDLFTLAYIDDDGDNACSDINIYQNQSGQNKIKSHKEHCGYVWIDHGENNFINSGKAAGDFLKMAENDGHTIYITGSKNWIRQYGTKIWKTVDAGKSWDLKLHQYNWDVVPFADWGEERIGYSAVALDIGWFDFGYESFDVNLRDANVVGATGLFFTFISTDGGEFWRAPFSKFADNGNKTANKKWASTGLEVTSVYKLKAHPINKNLIYAGMADIGGMSSDDGGKSFRIIHTENNSIYDYAFDRDDDRVLYAVTGSAHDFPISGYREPNKFEGGVWKSNDRGTHWLRLTDKDQEFNRQFVSIGFDSINKIIYAGSLGDGVAISVDQGTTWSYFNDGLPAGDKIISQIEIDPDNGDAYILLTGNAPRYYNSQQTGIYYLKYGSGEWKLLRGKINIPDEVMSRMKSDKRIKFVPWSFPTGFAIDFSKGSDRKTMWLVDHEVLGLYLQSGVWKSTDRGNTWDRQLQFTQTYSIALDQNAPENIYVSGFYQADGLWGNGGLYSTHDNGATWNKNLNLPYQTNAISTLLDPNDEQSIFYTFFGSAILHGKRK